MIRTPVVPCYAFRKYKEYWVQIDAPRHQFIFSKKAMEMLAEDAEFQLHDVLYDSYEIQFWGSEQYMRGIPLMDKRSYRINPKASMFTNEKIREFKRRGGELNEKTGWRSGLFLSIQTRIGMSN